MLSFYDAILYWNYITMESMLIWKRIKLIIFVNHPSFWWEIWKFIFSLKYLFINFWPHCAQCWYIVDAFHCLKSPPRILTRWYKKSRISRTAVFIMMEMCFLQRNFCCCPVSQSSQRLFSISNNQARRNSLKKWLGHPYTVGIICPSPWLE